MKSSGTNELKATLGGIRQVVDHFQEMNAKDVATLIGLEVSEEISDVQYKKIGIALIAIQKMSIAIREKLDSFNRDNRII